MLLMVSNHACCKCGRVHNSRQAKYCHQKVCKSNSKDLHLNMIESEVIRLTASVEELQKQNLELRTSVDELQRQNQKLRNIQLELRLVLDNAH